MIKGISRIKGLGVYDDYSRPAGTLEFVAKNLIYGWNYSGKTTLSRLFSQLESKTPNPDLSGCCFTLEADGSSITEANFAHSTLTVRVFNDDFVRDNLNFTGQSFKPILLLGKESEEAQKKLSHCEDLSKRIQERVNAASKKLDDFQSASATARTNTAAKIKKTLGLVEAYTATHLGGDISTVSRLKASQLLTEDKLHDDLKLALTPDSERPGTVDRLVASPSIEPLYEEAVEVLAATPSMVSTLKHLEENPLIEKWVETGIVLHKDKDKCEFCGGDLSEHRVEELQAHFSKDLSDHKRLVEQLHSRVKSVKVSIQLPKEAEFNPQFRAKFRQAVLPLPNSIDSFNEAVDILAADVQRKIDAPFKSQSPVSIPEGLGQAITRYVNAINQLIDDNNQIASNFAKAKADAIKRVKYHFVQEFIDEQAKVRLEAGVDRVKSDQARLNRLGETVQREADRLLAIISKAQLGREQINERLAFILGSEAVQIKVISDGGQDRFQLVRSNGSIATNLSSGEKTAIAFSYFLTKLKELKPEQFKETIVYIDDPISSLDSNHIFQVTAAIREFFFHQEQQGGAWTTKCNQIFISTHNFEFFHLLRELKPAGKSQAHLYLVKRIGIHTSTFGNMPDSLARYASEYHFLFGVIHRFHNAADKTDLDVLMLLPNAVRRFVELYTYSRLPGSSDQTVDQRAEVLFGAEKAKRILKIVHFFSHANTLERMAGNNELIFDVEHAVRDLFSEIETRDPLHWKALLESTSI